MLKEKEFPVYGDNGVKGTLLSAARFLDPSPEKRIRLEDGREIVVPASALSAQPDGSYYLRTGSADLPAAPRARETDPPVTSHERDGGLPPQARGSLSDEPRYPLKADTVDHVVEPERTAATVSAQESSSVDTGSRRPPEPTPRQVLSAEAAGPLFREDCDVERVSVQRIIDQPAETRQDGDTLIIPLMEEVLVVEKRLMLREELHIKRRREHKAESDRVPIPLEKLPR